VTPPVVGPDGRLSDMMLPPPAVVGQVSPAGPVPDASPMAPGPLPGPPQGEPLPAESGGG
jgi:phospholipid/cholesterol/gamma-HCH transport system substrate-binding protein